METRLKTVNMALFYTLLKHVACMNILSRGNYGVTFTHRNVKWHHQAKRCLPQRSYSTNTDVEAADDGTDTAADGKADRVIDPSVDRTKVIPVELSLKYIESEAYKTTYGDNPIWKLYRRNFKNQFPPRKTRRTCIKNGVIATGNPCPICKDEYLVIDYRNLKLLKQFISPYTDEIIDSYYTNICRKQHFKLKVAIEKARDLGFITFHVQQRVYDYKLYYPQASLDGCRTFTSSK